MVKGFAAINHEFICDKRIEPTTQLLGLIYASFASSSGEAFPGFDSLHELTMPSWKSLKRARHQLMTLGYLGRSRQVTRKAGKFSTVSYSDRVTEKLLHRGARKSTLYERSPENMQNPTKSETSREKLGFPPRVPLPRGLATEGGGTDTEKEEVKPVSRVNVKVSKKKHREAESSVFEEESLIDSDVDNFEGLRSGKTLAEGMTKPVDSGLELKFVSPGDSGEKLDCQLAQLAVSETKC